MTSRTHILGLDKPTVSPLSGAANPRAVLREQASIHERNRLDSVTEMMALVSMMTAKKILKGREAVTTAGAIYQFGTGVRADNTHAAHCLPGQLKFDERAIHTAEHWDFQRLKEHGLKPLALASKLRNLSGRTDAVDQTVNQVDSLIEAMGGGRGLKATYARSASGLMERVLYRAPSRVEDLGELIWAAMKQYRLAAGFACEERLDRLSELAHSLRKDEDPEPIARKTLVAERYLEIVQDSSFVPAPATPTGLLWLAKDVLESGEHVFDDDKL